MLLGPQQPKRVVPLALEGEHGVDDVLEHARARERALLGDMADEDHRGRAGLGQLHELRRALPHLCHRTG